MTTTSTLAAASTSLSHLLNHTKPRPTNLRRTRQKRRAKFAASNAVIKASEGFVESREEKEKKAKKMEQAIKLLSREGQVGKTELEVREKILDMRDEKAGKKSKRSKKRSAAELDFDFDDSE